MLYDNFTLLQKKVVQFINNSSNTEMYLMTINVPEFREVIFYKKTSLNFHSKNSRVMQEGISYPDKNIFIVKKLGKKVRKILVKYFDENKNNKLIFRVYSDFFYSRKR